MIPDNKKKKIFFSSYKMLSITRYRIYILLFLIVVLAPFYIGFSRFQEINILDDSEDKFLQDKNEQKRRQQLIEDTCQFLGINQTIDNILLSHMDHFIVDDTHKLIYCYVPKVACTNWKRIFLTLQKSNFKDPLAISGNETHRANSFKFLSQFSLEEARYKLKYYYKFFFSRHPYERILSAYRNKLEESYVNYFRLHFGTEIIKKFRTNPSSESLQKGHDVKFEEFIQYIISLDLKEWKKAFNEHWRPVFDLCFPCNVKYDFVGRYETLESDASYILEKTGVSKHIKFPTRKQTYSKLPTRTLMQNYYKNLSNEYHVRLFEIYKEDFMLFEYDTLYL